MDKTKGIKNLNLLTIIDDVSIINSIPKNMEIKLSHIDIVILAEAHNPSIISPEWLKNYKLISEVQKNFIYTPAFSMFESESFVLIVDQNRWQLTTKKLTEENIIKSFPDIAKKYVEILPHIPYKALGFNFIWKVQFEEKEKLSNIQLQLDSTNLQSIMSDHDITYGGIIYAKKISYLLRILIERQDNLSFTWNYNYNYEIKGLEAEKINVFLREFIDRYNHSQQILSKSYQK